MLEIYGHNGTNGTNGTHKSWIATPFEFGDKSTINCGDYRRGVFGGETCDSGDLQSFLTITNPAGVWKVCAVFGRSISVYPPHYFCMG